MHKNLFGKCALNSGTALAMMILVSTSLSGNVALAAINGEQEVMITQATIDYQAKNYANAQTALKTLLAIDPKNINALELLALSQRAMNDDEGAALTYQKLLKSGPKEKRPAYGFELGSIRYKQKKMTDARRLFNFAAAGNFNPGTSHFFVGIIDFNSKDWRSARHHLVAALTYDDSKPMTSVARYYLANAYAQLGRNDAAIVNFNAAREAAENEPGFKASDTQSMTGNIRRNALKELNALNKSARYLSLTYMTQYDSNVQTNPTEVDNPTAASSQRSAKSVLSIAAGYTTSPIQTVQLMPSFNFFTNYNYNSLARDFNFMSFTPSLYLLYKPYRRLSGGLKASGVFSMKNNLDPDQQQSQLKYRPFSLTSDIGPVVKYELFPKVNIAAEAYYRPMHYYLDPATGDSRRTGNGVYGKLSAEYVSGATWWNPTGYFSYEWDDTAGKDFRDYAMGGGLSNSVQITDRVSLTGNFDIVWNDYYQTLPKRDDTNMSFRVSGSYGISEHWTAIADMGYTVNQSSIAQVYKYNRFVTSAGATYSF